MDEMDDFSVISFRIFVMRLTVAAVPRTRGQENLLECPKVFSKFECRFHGID